MGSSGQQNEKRIGNKGSQYGKEEIKPSLCVDHMLMYIANPKSFFKPKNPAPEHPPRTNKRVRQGCRKKDKHTNSIAVLCTSNRRVETPKL